MGGCGLGAASQTPDSFSCAEGAKVSVSGIKLGDSSGDKIAASGGHGSLVGRISEDEPHAVDCVRD